MSDFSVEPNVVESAGAGIRSNVDAMNDSLETLNGAVGRLSGGWGGDAASAYLQAHSDWLTSMVSLTTAGAAAGPAAEFAADGYRQADDYVGSLWGI